MDRVYLVSRTGMISGVQIHETLRIYRELDKALKYVASRTGRKAKVLKEHVVHGFIDVPDDSGFIYSVEENALE